MMYHIARLAFSILPILFGLFILSNTLLDATASMQADQWPTTQGMIVNYDEGRLFNYSGSSGATLSYRYTVQGEEHIGRRAAFGGGISDVSQVAGGGITVYYNPLNHTESALQVGFRIGYLLQALIGVALIWVGKNLWQRLK